MRHDVADIVLCQLIHRSLLSAGLTTASRYHWVPWRWNLLRDYCLLRYKQSLLVALTIVSNYFCLLSPDISFILLPDNFEALVDISLSSLSRDTWPVTDQSNRLSNMSLFTLGSRQRSGGWHSRKLGANTRSYEREHVAFNCAHVINYHRWVVISRDKRDSLIVARLLPPRSLESARACVRAFVRTYVRTYVWIYECVCVWVCVVRVRARAPVGSRSNPGAIRWRTDVLTGCSAPTTGVRWTIRREASGGRSATHSTPPRIWHPSSYPRHPPWTARCSAFARITLSSRGHRRTRCHAKLHNIFENTIRAIENELFGVVLVFAEKNIRHRFGRHTDEKKTCCLSIICLDSDVNPDVIITFHILSLDIKLFKCKCN